MELVTQANGLLSSFLSYALPFLAVLTVIVFFHELGHFLVARWCGVRVETFSVGFGPELFGRTDREGTRWKFSLIPLGGYVRFFGDDNPASVPDTEKIDHMTPEERAQSFHEQPLGARAAVVAAGPFANFILAIVIFALMFSIVGRQITTAKVDAIQPGSAAEAAGFQTGDVITSIDGSPIDSFSDMQRIVSMSADTELTIVVERNGEQVTLTAVPERKEITDRFGNTHRIGLLGISRSLAGGDVELVRYDPATAVWMGVHETYFVIARTLGYLGEVVTGRQDAGQLGGPLRIAQVSGQVATVSLAALINLAAVLSVSIGLINLFPIPMLDGGHLLFYAIEAVRGEPLSDKMQEFGFRLGLAIVLALMVFATWNDLVHLNVF